MRLLLRIFLAVTHSQHPVRICLRRDYGIRADSFRN